jgi:phage shock protein C
MENPVTDTASLTPVSCTAGRHREGWRAMAQTRKLYRSRTHRKRAGVCGGLAQYFNADATLIRVLFVVLALLGGPGPRHLSGAVDPRSGGAARHGLTGASAGPV